MPVHPRLRGELDANIKTIFSVCGSSPLTRGTLRGAEYKRIAQPVHPRLRGELTTSLPRLFYVSGSSPLTRGTQTPPHQCERGARFIPAYAGNSTNLDSFSDWSTVHPRLRGELNTNNIVDPAQVGSSPLTRGTLTRFLISATTLPVHPRLRGELDDYETWKEGGKWFIPAYAGNSRALKTQAA